MNIRIRWGNLARLFAVVGVVALVVAWPRMGPAEVALPPEGAVPVAAASVEPEFDAVPEVSTPAPRAAKRSARPRPKRRRARRTAQVRAVVTPAPVVSPRVAVAPPLRRVYRAPLPEFGAE